MKKLIFLISTIIIVWPALAQGAVAVSALDISNQKDCEVLGGQWNTCPPNDCQESADYKNGQVMCPEVCGAPICQGLLPAEPVDLSNIHNESIGHQSLPFDENLNDNQTLPESPIEIAPPFLLDANETQKQLNILNFRDFLPAAFGLLLGIVLILIGIVALRKKAKK